MKETIWLTQCFLCPRYYLRPSKIAVIRALAQHLLQEHQIRWGEATRLAKGRGAEVVGEREKLKKGNPFVTLGYAEERRKLIEKSRI